jgi:hypothetical protein
MCPARSCVYVAEQVGAACASWPSGYLDRRTTRFEHVAKITTTYGYREFAVVEVEFVQWLNDRAWSRRGRGGRRSAVASGGSDGSAVGARRGSRRPVGSQSGFRGRRLGFSAYCPHCFIVVFDPRCSCRATSSCRAYFNGKLLARWLDAPMHYRFLSRRGHRPVVGARSVRHDQRRSRVEECRSATDRNADCRPSVASRLLRSWWPAALAGTGVAL